MTTSVHPTSTASQRLYSIDALRGLDMLMIAGGGACIELLEGKTGLAFVDHLAEQLKHPAWNGFTFYDFIFPLFLFIAGVSIPFSIQKGLALGVSKTTIYRKAFRRMIILIILGIMDKNTPITFFEPANIRVASVLGRIGIASFIAAVVYLNFTIRQRLLLVGGVLLFYYGLLFLVPVPGFSAGDLSFEGNLVGWFDRHFLPGRLLQKTYDENGILTQMPAACLSILGTIAGDLLRSGKSAEHKLRVLCLGGAVALALSFVWSLHFPINKHLWTSSFILLTGGLAFLSIALFYWVIDVLHFRKWAFFFYVIGMNSLTIYLLYRFIDFGRSAEMIFSGLYAPVDERFHPALEALGALVIVWLILYFLYRQKIFIKI